MFALRRNHKTFSNIWPVFLFLVLSFAFSFPLLRDLYTSCSGDWDYFMHLYEVPSMTFFEYRQFPLWNPYCGGGFSLIGNPQAGFLSPIFILTTIFGVTAGLKVSVWLHTFLGLWGMWALSGHLGIHGPARLAPSFVFMFSGAWAMHLAMGHIVWLPVALLPFFFLTFLKSLENRWWLLAASLAESIMFYEGGTYVFAFSLLFVFIYAVVTSFEKKSYWPVSLFIIINFVATALSSPKLLPVIELLQSHPRPTDASSGIPLDIFLYFFIDRFTSIERSPVIGWWAFGSYLGIVVVSLYLFSFTLFRRNKALVISSFFLLLLSIGDFSTLSPWHILHEFPFFDGFKVPTRVLVVFCFGAALLVGRTLAHFQSDQSRSNLLIGMTVLIIFLDLASVSFPILYDAVKPISTPHWERLRIEQNLEPAKLYRLSPESTARLWHTNPSAHHPFTQISIPFDKRNMHGAWSDQYLPLLNNIGVVDAYETIPFKRNVKANTDDSYNGEFYLVGEGSVTIKGWGPNTFEYHVKTEAGNRLVINQNFAQGWQTSQGSLVSYEGLLAVDLEAGDYELTVDYAPKSFRYGVKLLLIASVIILLTVTVRLFASQKK